MPVQFNKVNPDLAKERKNASFDPNEFATWFYGGENKLQMKRKIEAEVYSDLDESFEYNFLSYEDVYTDAIKNTVNGATKLRKLQEKFNPGGNEIYPTLMEGPIATALMPTGNPLSVHFIMFTEALRGQGTPEQYEKFGRRADNCEIIGTYAQTELGHGTFVRGLETRADYDRQTEEFVLNTPTLTSYKFWPGAMGQTANYCILVAQLYIDNESKGIQLFVLQLRDEQTHRPLPGIDIGDIGRKLGHMGINNGYLGLKNVRVPRTNMLMKNAKVLPDGTFIKSPVSQLSYLPMVYVRCGVALANAMLLAQAATIATRYSVVRRQSPINPDEPEPQILEHVTQQLKVLPEISIAIAYRLAAGELIKLHEQTLQAINRGDYSRMPELHALACTLKASCSYDSTFGIERLRQSCGGHGFLAAAGFASLFTTATAACTYEGENSVLYLQVGRILLKTWANVLEGKQLMSTMAYLSELAAWSKFPQWTGTMDCLVKALQYAATNKTRIAYKSFKARLQQGRTLPEAFNDTGIELTQAAELHGRAFVANTFLQTVREQAASQRSPQLKMVLQQLLELYLLHTVFRHMADIARFITLSDDDLADLQDRLESVLKQIRTNAVAICDGFDFHDFTLHSVLGCYDGNVYERIFDSAKQSPLNQKPVPKAFDLYLKPFMRSNL